MAHYLNVTVTAKSGRKFFNHLKTGESHLISKLCKENREVLIKMVECDKSFLTILFGKDRLPRNRPCNDMVESCGCETEPHVCAIDEDEDMEEDDECDL